MNTYLEQFWKWSNRTFDEYARIGMNQNKGEYEDQFPLFDEMIAYARTVVDNVVTDDSDLDDLLTIMALDNEAETVLDYVEGNSTADQFDKIIALGLKHVQPHARWQIAELLYRRKPKNYMELLYVLSQDEHPSVRQRAQNYIH